MAIRKSAAVSMRPELKELAEARAEALGLNFSAYVNQLIRADLAARKELVVREESAVYKSPTKKRAKKEASKD